MARGIVIGQVFDSSSDPVADTQVALTAVRGADVNGVLVKYTVPRITYRNLPIEQRLTNGDGVFAIPFSWDEANADNFARVAGVDIIQIKVTVLLETEGKSLEGSGFKVLDGIQLLNNIKTGELMGTGSFQDIFDELKPQFEDAITGDEFHGIPFTMLSTEQIAILGLLPNLRT
jgi:hypothetical protein